MGIKIFFTIPTTGTGALLSFVFTSTILLLYNRSPDVQYLVFSIVVFPMQTLNLFLPQTRECPNHESRLQRMVVDHGDDVAYFFECVRVSVRVFALNRVCKTLIGGSIPLRVSNFRSLSTPGFSIKFLAFSIPLGKTSGINPGRFPRPLRPVDSRVPTLGGALYFEATPLHLSFGDNASGLLDRAELCGGTKTRPTAANAAGDPVGGCYWDRRPCRNHPG